MQITKDCVVSFHYRLSETGANEIENTHGEEPVAFLVGHHNLMPALEAAFEGKSAGDTFTVDLTPEQAYGEKNDNAVMRIPQKHLMGYERIKNHLRPGMRVAVNTDHGPRDVIIVKVGKFNVDVDTNHPLSGKALSFEVEITEVRAASHEELEHGHVHGPGGHHH